ncbi:MAG: hypothetical protein ACK551_08205 [Vampirovibrionales bacterium]
MLLVSPASSSSNAFVSTPKATQQKATSPQRVGGNLITTLFKSPGFESLNNAYKADMSLYEQATKVSDNLLLQMRLLRSALSSLGRLISFVEKNWFNPELQTALSQQDLTLHQTLESLKATRRGLLLQNHDHAKHFRVRGIRYQLGQFLGLRYAWDDFFSRLEAEKFLQKAKQS